MNDTERDLRELFETKAREAGPAPRVTPEILRRGRRRQVGTVAVAGITALAIAAAAIVSLQALNRADTDTVPGGRQGNPAFTATIQNFTVTVPEGWTLIDQWPLGSNLAVEGSGGTSFSCVGMPIEAGSGKNIASGPATSDCPAQQTQTPERPTIPEGGLPMLALSNDDPGLGGSACNAGSPLPATSARLYIGLDYGVTRTAGWENMPAWPNPLVNVLEGDLPVEQMPCGPGGYSWFQTGGAPYIAWAGFGSEVTAADRQALLDVFDGMRVSDGEITPPTTDMPGYVLTGGTTGSGAGWNVEAYPNGTNVDMAYAEEGGRWGGAGSFGPPVVPIQLASGHGIDFGAVTFDADRVELRPSDGSDPVPGSILRLPESLGAPFDAFVIPSSAAGEVVAVGPDGDLGSAGVSIPAPEPSPDARRVESDLRNAYVAAKTYYVDGNTYEGFDPQTAVSIEPSLAYNTAGRAVAGEVSIRDVGADHILFAEATDAGDVLCIAENSAGATTYGAVDAQMADECVGGEAAWGQDVTASGSAAPSQPVESSVDLQGFGAPATLTVRSETANGCQSMEIQIGGDNGIGMGSCVNGPLQPDEPLAVMQPAASGDGVTVVSGHVPPEADRVFFVSDDGRRFDAPILYTLQVEPRVQFFAFAVPVRSGQLHVEDVNGVELSAPIPLSRAS